MTLLLNKFVSKFPLDETCQTSKAKKSDLATTMTSSFDFKNYFAKSTDFEQTLWPDFCLFVLPC